MRDGEWRGRAMIRLTQPEANISSPPVPGGIPSRNISTFATIRHVCTYS
jgi:hypothetical protein